MITYEYVKQLSEVDVNDFDFKIVFTDEQGKTLTRGVLVPVNGQTIVFSKLEKSIENIINEMRSKFPDGFPDDF